MKQDKINKVQIYVVDDEPAVRKGLKLLLNRQPDLQVCGEADTGAEAAKQIPSLRPDVAIVDLTLKEDNGLKVTRQLRQNFPALKILIFSMHSELAMVQAAFKAGADGYVTKEEGTEKLVEAMHVLLQGKRYLGKAHATKVTADYPAWMISHLAPPKLRAPNPRFASPPP